MAVELIITSVRKGLDGGSGYQPVLRTKDLKPPVAERLQLRSGYSHPFPHGDRRNPVVHVHRIERVAGETLHVIARLCDAGSDHTGRSNFLAHFVAMDEAEARRKPAGPAEVMRRLAFKTSWDEPAREAAPPTVVGGDRQPGPCRAWKDAGLDPGIAGDLAEAAMSGREVTLVSRDSDDVLSLFADALALVAPAKRWQVTFNTCRIEPFDGTWQAIRHDLPQAGGLRSGPGVIDLSTNPRGGNGPYAAYARGDAASLPWQQSAKGGDSAGEQRDQPSAVAKPSPVQGPNGDSGLSPIAAAGRPSPLSSPRPKRRLGRGSEDRISDEEPSGRSAITGLRLMALAMGSVVVVVVALVGSVVFLPPDKWPDWARSRDETNAAPGVSNAAPTTVDLGEAERAHREREKARMAEQQHNEQKQREEAKATAEATAQAAEAKRLEDEKRRADSEAEKLKREQEAKRQRAAAAIAALRKMPEIVVQDLVAGGGLGTLRVNDVDLGTFDIDALAEPGFALAVPKDVCDGAAFNAWVEEPQAGQKSWRILAASRAIDGGAAGPLHLATLTARDGNLYLRAVDDKAAKNPRFNLLRRSVLLVKARDPAEPSGKATVHRAIQLVQPVKGRMQWDGVSLWEESQKEFSLPRPAATTFVSSGTGHPMALPADTKIAYEVRFDYPLQYQDGKPLDKPVVRQFHGDTFCPLLESPLPGRPFVGVDIAISFDGGVFRVRPEVRGEGKDAIDLRKLAKLVGTTERQFDDWFKQEIADLKKRVAGARRQLPDTKQRQRDFSLILSGSCFDTANKENLEQFFVQQDLFPQPKDKDHKPLDQYPDRVTRWSKKCEQFMQHADRESWEKEVAFPLGNWLKHYEQTQYENMQQRRAQLQPLNGPVTIVVTELSSPAYGEDGKRYDVTLAKPLEKNATGSRPGTTSSDLD